MSSYKRPRVFDLSTWRLSTWSMRQPWRRSQHANRSDPSKDVECQESLKKLVFLLAKPGSVEFDDLLDKVLEHASQLVSSSQLQTRPASEIEGDSGKRPL